MTERTIYLVSNGSYSEYRVVAAYDNHTDAAEYVRRGNQDEPYGEYMVEEMWLNPEIPEARYRMWCYPPGAPMPSYQRIRCWGGSVLGANLQPPVGNARDALLTVVAETKAACLAQLRAFLGVDDLGEVQP